MHRNFLVFEPRDVQWAGMCRYPPSFGARKNRSSQAQRAGLKYERKAQEHMMALYPDSYVPSPWLMFRLKSEPLLRYCQPDGFVCDIERGIITIVEIKLRHCAEAYSQVIGIYWPVLKQIFPTFEFRWMELTRFYDPMTDFPVPVQMVSDVDLVPRGRFAVHIWNPARA